MRRDNGYDLMYSSYIVLDIVSYVYIPNIVESKNILEYFTCIMSTCPSIKHYYLHAKNIFPEIRKIKAYKKDAVSYRYKN